MEKRGIYIRYFKRYKNGAIGIGAMIIFIAMVLVAGIAAYVILSTSSQLQITTSTTGSQTITDVSTGLKITKIEGHNTSGEIDKMIIYITPCSGSPDIELDRTLIEISDSSMKCILQYSSTYWVNSTSGTSDLFAVNAFSSTAGDFGIIVLKDDDYSCLQNVPIVNRGDSVIVSLNTTAIFGGIGGSVNILGNIVPEYGTWSSIQFRTPSSCSTAVVTLFEE